MDAIGKGWNRTEIDNKVKVNLTVFGISLQYKVEPYQEAVIRQAAKELQRGWEGMKQQLNGDDQTKILASAALGVVFSILLNQQRNNTELTKEKLTELKLKLDQILEEEV